MDLFGTALDPEVAIVVKLGISIALGGLAGLEREYAKKDKTAREGVRGNQDVHPHRHDGHDLCDV